MRTSRQYWKLKPLLLPDNKAAGLTIATETSDDEGTP
jgi:hypothetical protein